MDKELRVSGITKNFRPYLTADLKQQADSMEDVDDYTLGDPDYGPPKRVLKATVRDIMAFGSNRYQMRDAHRDVRKEIAAWYKRIHKVDLNPETEIEIGPGGAKVLIREVDDCLIGQGFEVGYPHPCYPITGESIELSGGKPIPYYVGLRNDLHQASDPVFEDHSNLAGFKTQFPHNPTTRAADLKYYNWLVGKARKRGVWIVSDNPYGFTGCTPTILQATGAMKNTIELNTVSKRYGMQGWRFGWAAGAPELIKELIDLHKHTLYGAWRPIKAGVIEAIRHGDKEAEKNRDIVWERLRALSAGMQKIGWVEAVLPDPMTETLFAWFHTPAIYQHLGSVGFSQLLLEKARIAASPGITYGDDTRVRFSGVLSVDRIQASCERAKVLFQD